MEKSIEILAPVGNNDSLIAAVYSGADAVYFGGSHFNARRNADNFGEFDLKEAIKFCRLNGVKAYLTLNILIKENELNAALELAKDAYTAGIDGVIVQDLGLAKVLRQRLPKLKLHASTQLSTLSPAALYLLKEMGFTRVVPARELSEIELADLTKTAHSLTMEVEAFVHGALCMSVSGQCYFSAYLGGRSANRGLCAGTCRLPFLVEKGTGYDLSLKDLSLVTKTQQLKNIGVSSLKIEGRMKRPEYVAKTVSCLRKAVKEDNIDKEDLSILQKVFSRDGFTEGYFNSELGKSMFGRRTENDKLLTGEVLKQIHDIYRRPMQRIHIDFEVEIIKDTPLKVTALCNENKVTLEGITPEIALNRPIDKERIKECFSKLGGTPYLLNNIKITLDEGITLPISTLNALKKQALDEISSLRASEIPCDSKTKLPYVKAKQRNIKDFFIRFNSLSQMAAFSEKDIKISGYSLPVEEALKLAVDEFPLNISLLSAEIPRGYTDDRKLYKKLEILKSKGITSALCHTLSAIKAATDVGLIPIGGFGLNVFNSYTLSALSDMGLKEVTASPELTFSELAEIDSKNIKLMAICYGRQPLMLTRNCPGKNGVGCSGKKDYCEITDRLGIKFPMICGDGFTEILNSKPTNLSDMTNKISADTALLNMTVETPGEAYKIYTDFIKSAHPKDGYTRGLYKNGVL